MTGTGMMETALGHDEIAAVATIIGRQMRQADVPIDSGYGVETRVWDPEQAYRAEQARIWHQERHVGLAASIAGMEDTSTVRDCPMRYFEHDESSDKPPVVQYCDYLGTEATRWAATVEYSGGRAAVEEFAASLAFEQVDDQ